jgi:hypothetical protein
MDVLKGTVAFFVFLSVFSIVLFAVWAVLGQLLMLVLSSLAGVPYSFKENGHIGMILILFGIYVIYGGMWVWKKWKESGQPTLGQYHGMD